MQQISTCRVQDKKRLGRGDDPLRILQMIEIWPYYYCGVTGTPHRLDWFKDYIRAAPMLGSRWLRSHNPRSRPHDVGAGEGWHSRRVVTIFISSRLRGLYPQTLSLSGGARFTVQRLRHLFQGNADEARSIFRVTERVLAMALRPEQP